MKAQIAQLWENKWQIILPLLILGGAGLFTAYLMQSEPRAERGSRPPAQPRLVEVQPVEPGDHPVRIEAYGEVQPSRDVSLSPQVSGEIVETSGNLVPGGRLEKGELVVQIDPSDYKLAVEQAKSQLDTALANMRIEQGNQVVAEAEYEFLGQDLAEAERELVLREPQLQQAKAEVASARAALEEARLDLKRTKITAPFDALVMSKDIDVGTRVSQSTTIARVVGIHNYWVELNIPASSLKWISEEAVSAGEGPTVRLTYEGAWDGNEHRTGQIIRIQGTLSTEGRLAQVLVEIPDPLALEPAHKGVPRVLIGSYLKAEVVGRMLENVVALDRSLLREGDTVWVMNEQDELEVRPVEVAYAGRGEVLISNGLSSGDRVIITDIPTATDGMPLRVQKPEASPAVLGRRGEDDGADT